MTGIIIIFKRSEHLKISWKLLLFRNMRFSIVNLCHVWIIIIFIFTFLDLLYYGFCFVESVIDDHFKRGGKMIRGIFKLL